MWDTDAQREVHDRLTTLSADRRAQWGKMSAQQMVCHLSESLKMALGDLKVAPKKLPIRYPPLKQLIIYLAPFPKNAPTAPELVITSTPNAWARDVETPQALVDRFAARGRDATGRPSCIRPPVPAGLGRARLPAHGSSPADSLGLSVKLMDDKRALLRHTVATVAYRGGKAVRGAPASFATFASGDPPKTPAQILAHIGDLFDWALSIAEGAQKWNNSTPLAVGRRSGPLLSAP